MKKRTGQRSCEDNQEKTDAIHWTHQESEGAGGYVSDRQYKRKKVKGLAKKEVYGWNTGSNGREMDSNQSAGQNRRFKELEFHGCQRPEEYCTSMMMKY